MEKGNALVMDNGFLVFMIVKQVIMVIYIMAIMNSHCGFLVFTSAVVSLTILLKTHMFARYFPE